MTPRRLLFVLLACFLAGDLLARNTISWNEGRLSAAQKEARIHDKLVLIAFMPEWSEYSNRIVDETFTDERVVEALDAYACYQLREQNAEFEKLVEKYNIQGFPAMVVTRANGHIEELIEGYIPPEPLIEQLARIREGKDTLTYFDERADEEPRDLFRRLELAWKWSALGDGDRHDRLVASIRRDDPEGETYAGCKVMLDEAWAEVDPDAEEFHVEPVLMALEQAGEPRARQECWTQVGSGYARRGQMVEARRAFMTAAPDVSDEDVVGWGQGVANFFLEHGEGQLDEDERRFVVDLATRVVEGAEAVVAEYEAEGSEEEGDWDAQAWLAERVDLLVWCQYTFGEGSDAERAAAALRSVERCLELDPENPEYQGRHDMLAAAL